MDEFDMQECPYCEDIIMDEFDMQECPYCEDII